VIRRYHRFGGICSLQYQGRSGKCSDQIMVTHFLQFQHHTFTLQCW